jgi:hypothetical protein
VSDGWRWELRRGERVRDLRFALERDDWRPPVAVQVEGVTPDLLHQFGLV